jgi:cytochrome c oxidase assembly protein subunit 11
MNQPCTPQQRNARMAVGLGVLVAGMVGLSFASVPLYSLFCRVTGFGGTTQVATGVSDRVLDRVMEIRFNADVNNSIGWDFKPETHSLKVRVGEPATTLYHAHNRENRAVVGTAAYNVTPDKAGIYFQKIQCFCFTEQRLEAGQSVEMPVYFYVDPAIADDPELDDVKTITLSYTFFRAADQSAALPGDGPGEAGRQGEATPSAGAGAERAMTGRQQ